jgi:hypothetical protein
MLKVLSKKKLDFFFRRRCAPLHHPAAHLGVLPHSSCGCRLEYEAIALGDALATAAGKAVLDLQGADRFVEVDAPEPW